MPTARVGAMPHYSQEGNDASEGTMKKKSKDRRKKGITMEDLKQQTADRLAKEQRRRNAVANKTTRRNVHVQAQDPTQLNLVQSTSLEITVSCDNSVSSSSYQNSPHISSQRAVDDFPHSRFDFVHKDHVARPVVGRHTDAYQSPRMKVHQQHPHQSPQKFAQQKYHQGHVVGAEGKNPSQNHLNSGRSTHSVGSGSASNKLPHGLTVQELKEMTRARLAAEAAEVGETVKSSDSVDAENASQSQTYSSSNQVRARLYSHESRDNSIGRPMICATDSFGSNVERQRLGSVESFGSARSAYTGSGYHGRGILTPSLLQEQPPLTSFSYDAMDNESYASAMGTESIFGSETHSSKTTKYSTNSSVYRIPYSSEKSSPASHNTKITSNNGRQRLWSDPFVRSSSPVPTIANSTTTSFGHSENGTASFFTSTTPLGKLERMISSGGVVPNAVAESVLGTSDDNLGNHLSGFYGGLDNSPSALVSPESKKPCTDHAVPYTSPWSNPTERYSDEGEVDSGIAKLQSEWNAYLNIEVKDTADDFPSSTFISKSKDSQSNLSRTNQTFFSSTFQTVPEEKVVQNLMSRDVNVPERFIDEPDEEVTAPKISNMMRRKKSRNSENLA